MILNVLCILYHVISFKMIYVVFFFQIQLVLGTESNIAVGWQKKEEKTSASGELKVPLTIGIPISLFLAFQCKFMIPVLLLQMNENFLFLSHDHLDAVFLDEGTLYFKIMVKVNDYHF